MLILGTGNTLRGDDAAGLHAARRLRGRVPASVAVVEREGDLATALDVWKDHDAVVVIDAMRSGGRPGTIVRLRAHERPLPAVFARSSTHALGLAEVVELGRVMNTLPASVIVYGIEGKSFELGEGLSSEVEPAVGEVVERVLRELPYRA
jgi:hydrogenase maturation protease